MRTRTWLGILGALLAVGATRTAAASYPAGVWARARQIVFEPNAASPERIQIHGAFMVYDKSSGNAYPGYSAPALGFMYYACPAAQSSTCAQEWADIVTNMTAPPNECVGLGDQSIPTGTLRTPSAPAQTPDIYPIAMGVLPGFLPCSLLQDFLASGDDGGAAGGTGGTAGSSAAGGSDGAQGGASGSTSGGGSRASGGGPSGSAGSSTSSPSSGDTQADAGCTVMRGPRSGVVGALLLALCAGLFFRRRSARFARSPSPESSDRAGI